MAKKQDDDIDLGDDYDPEEDEEDTSEEEEKPKKKPRKDPFIWKHFSQPAFEGLQNSETGEVIADREVLRRILSYAEEAAKNTR
jgi:hypothetical protein